MAEEKPVKELQNFVKEDQGNATRNVAIGLGGAAILTGAAILGSGAFRGEQTQTTPPPDNTAAAASPTPPEKTVIPTPAGKVEVTFPPTASPTAEVKKEVPCLILEQKYCDQAEYFTTKDEKTGEVKRYIGWKDLPSGTSLSSLIDGQRTIIDRIKESNPPSPFQGFSLLSIYPVDRSVTHTFIGNLSIPDSPLIKKGESIGSVSSSNAKVFGEYTLIYTATRKDASGNPMIDEKGMKELFPKAFEVPPKEFPFNTQGSTILTNPNYYNTQNKP